jgi:hypothetical protein
MTQRSCLRYCRHASVVSIVGIVSTAQIVRRAHAALKRIPGIKKIDNRLVSGEQMGWD